MKWLYKFLLITSLLILIIPGFVPVENLQIQAQDSGGFLLLNEISPFGSDDKTWIEIINPTSDPVLLDGWTIELYSGFSYTFPDNSTEIPGSGLHVLEINGNPFNPQGDGCALIGPDGPADAISWGYPPAPPVTTILSGLPLQPDADFLPDASKPFNPDDVCIRVPSSLADEIQNPVGSIHWVIRDGNQSTSGEPNPPPGPWIMLPVDGSTIASGFNLAAGGLEWAENITFQVSTDDQFQEITLEATVADFYLPVTDLETGDYYWRVRGEDGDWSISQTFTIAPYNIDDLIAAAPKDGDSKAGGSLLGLHKILGLPHIKQYKDTDMLCLDGCRMDGAYAWDVAHPMTTLAGKHNPKYCVRASLAMIAGQYGNTLSQDRISYYINEEVGTNGSSSVLTGNIGNPFGDLGHGRGSDQIDCQRALEWIYGTAKGTSEWWTNAPDKFYNSSPAMDSILEYIDDDRPCVRVTAMHATVIDGYAVIPNDPGPPEAYVHVLDPWYLGPTAQMWLLFQPSLCISLIMPPTTGRQIRSDEDSLMQDSDADGINDFDEINRLHTDPNNQDSDDDDVNDREDMLGYLFDPSGDYFLRERDFDNDGVPKELDPDSDRASNNGASDGCEDMDHNGFFAETGTETDCFYSGDDFSIVNPDCYRGFIKHNAYCYEVCDDCILEFHWWETIIIEAGEPVESTESVHKFTWGWKHLETPYDPIDAMQWADHTGEGTAQITIQSDESGQFSMIVKSDPSMVECLTIFDWPDTHQHDERMVEIPFMFGYGFTYQLGTAERDANGGLVLRGELPQTVEQQPNCEKVRTWWEIWIEPPA